MNEAFRALEALDDACATFRGNLWLAGKLREILAEPENPENVLVRDCDGDIWKYHHEEGWYTLDNGSYFYPWDTVLEFAPVTIFRREG